VSSDAPVDTPPETDINNIPITELPQIASLNHHHIICNTIWRKKNTVSGNPAIYPRHKPLTSARMNRLNTSCAAYSLALPQISDKLTP